MTQRTGAEVADRRPVVSWRTVEGGRRDAVVEAMARDMRLGCASWLGPRPGAADR
jgi:hypothetical protein